MSSHSSPESEDLTSASSGPGSESSDNAKPTQGAEKCCGGIGPECRCRRTSPPSTGSGSEVMAFTQNQSDHVRDLGHLAGALRSTAGMGRETYLLFNPSRSQTAPGEWEERFKPDTIHDALTAQEPPKGRPLILSVEASPAKTSPSPESEPALPGKDQDCSMKPHESQTLFSDQEDGSSLRTFPDYLAPMEELTSGSYSRRWPTSGFTTSPGEFWTADTSECPSGGGEYSSLPDVLEATVPSRFYLSPKAAAGILRRAERRGKNLPPALDKALRDLSDSAAQEATPNPTDTEPTSQEAA